MALIHNDVAQISVAKSDTDPKIIASLNAFREKAKTGRVVRFWNDRTSLRADFIESFTITMSRFPATGWVRGNTIANEAVLAQINAVRDENDRLRQVIVDTAPKQLQPVPGIADLDDGFPIRFSYAFFANNTRHVAYQEFSMTWRQIFATFCAELIKPTQPDFIKNALVIFLLQRRVTDKSITILEECYAAIKVQFMALGLIDVYESEATGGGVSEFAKLTAQGRVTMIDSLAVRKVFTS